MFDDSPVRLAVGKRRQPSPFLRLITASLLTPERVRVSDAAHEPHDDGLVKYSPRCYSWVQFWSVLTVDDICVRPPFPMTSTLTRVPRVLPLQPRFACLLLKPSVRRLMLDQGSQKRPLGFSLQTPSGLCHLPPDSFLCGAFQRY